MKRLASKKPYSWWWDSHISPKNSKWLAENLEEMDKLVKEMLKLIDEEGDSFAKKAEMYYQRRPELLGHVEDFYRMYRALAERYDNVTGELRNSMAAKTLHSQGSGGGSDFGSRSPSPSPEHTPNHKLPKTKPTPRAAGFEVFLGSGGSSDISRNASDSSSLSSDSESETEDVKEETIMDADGQHQRIIDLENELLGLKQKLNEYEEVGLSGPCIRMGREDLEGLRSRALDMERELSDAIERLHVSEVEIMRLTEELEKKDQTSENSENGNDTLHSRVLELEKAIIDANERLHLSEEEITQLKQDLEKNEQNHAGMLSGRKHTTELEGQIMMLEAEVMNLTCEIELLRETYTTALERCKADISARDESIQKLDLEIANINESHLQDKFRLKADVADHACVVEQLKASIQSFSHEKLSLEQKVLEQENMIEELKAALDDSTENFSQESSRLKADIFGLSESHRSLELKLVLMENEIRKSQAEKTEISAASAKHVEELNKKLDDLKHKLDILKSEKLELGARVHALTQDVESRDDRISNMDEHLQQLHLEHLKLVKEADEAQGVSKEMQVRLKELEDEVERQRIAISDGAEGKREAIRQLCFSLEHYRLGYQELRQALQGYKRPRTVVVS